MRLLSLIILTALLSMLSTGLSAQVDAISKYFSKYMDDDRFTTVYVSPRMFEMFKKMDLELDDQEAEAIMEVVKELKGLRILVADEVSMEETKSLYKEAVSTINTTEYEILMTVKSKNKDNVQFLIKDQASGDVVNELLLLVGSEDTFVLMSFVGSIDLNKVSELAESFDID